MRILGVDPGLSTTGIGVIEAEGDSLSALDWMAITSDTALPLSERLQEIAADFEQILDEAKPELAVVEQIFFAKNEKTAINVAHARGVYLMLLGKRGIPVLEVTPMQLKLAITGDGAADKTQMGTMLLRWLKLDAVPTPADAADALALAVYGAHMRKQLAV
ncbi:crossover junction endodeoxyribonuclease RuvC [Candidatus Peribacteria bacterium RIFCSPHIGHO2_01_FULL_55_13]|nr:MAG: crossover junction endodeoxyribonuclease RuvC [Candidatus Peribacteria bacterium RIFCSPHIGHO2_01_FULL_55_13]OGJ66131.1 MAG: crossover junction endodeoxyribonuclease RuvC [Candidatus Peribacteria bacterium RIFCSPHIGHO2_12_FULL_55_11]